MCYRERGSGVGRAREKRGEKVYNRDSGETRPWCKGKTNAWWGLRFVRCSHTPVCAPSPRQRMLLHVACACAASWSPLKHASCIIVRIALGCVFVLVLLQIYRFTFASIYRQEKGSGARQRGAAARSNPVRCKHKEKQHKREVRSLLQSPPVKPRSLSLSLSLKKS